MPPHLRRVDPRVEIVLHASRHKIGRVSDHLWADTDVTLLDELDRFAHRLGKLQADEDNGSGGGGSGADAAIRSHADSRFFWITPSPWSLSSSRSVTSTRTASRSSSFLSSVTSFVAAPDQRSARVVILTVLDEIPPQHVHLAQIVFVAPVEEVRPLEELGLVILELSHALLHRRPVASQGVLHEQRLLRGFLQQYALTQTLPRDQSRTCQEHLTRSACRSPASPSLSRSPADGGQPASGGLEGCRPRARRLRAESRPALQPRVGGGALVLQSTPLHTVLVEWMLERTRVELAAHAVPSFWAHWRRLAPSSHQAGDVTPHEVHHRCQLAMFDAVHEIRTCVVAQLRTLRLVERANAVAPSPMDTGEITAYEAGSAGARLLAGLPALLISAAPSEAAFGTWMTMCWERSFHDWREVRRSGAPETASDDPWISFGDCDGDDDASDSDGDGGGGAGGGGGGRGGGVGGAAGKDDGMAVDEGGRAGSAAARRLQRLRPFCEELHELSWLPLSEATSLIDAPRTASCPPASALRGPHH